MMSLSIYTYICISICIHICVCICIHMCVCVYTHMYIYVYIYSDITKTVLAYCIIWKSALLLQSETYSQTPFFSWFSKVGACWFEFFSQAFPVSLTVLPRPHFWWLGSSPHKGTTSCFSYAVADSYQATFCLCRGPSFSRAACPVRHMSVHGWPSS